MAAAELTGLERAWLKLVRPAGIILFKRNIVDAGQTRGLLGEAAGFCAGNALRCVDVEGGTVDRLRDALAPMPSAQAVGRAMMTPTHRDKAAMDGAQGGVSSYEDPRSQKRDRGHPTAWAKEHGELVGRGVRAFGFNATLAPVLDLGLAASAGVMGTHPHRPRAWTARRLLASSDGFATCL